MYKAFSGLNDGPALHEFDILGIAKVSNMFSRIEAPFDDCDALDAVHFLRKTKSTLIAAKRAYESQGRRQQS